jgi:hypothetical protein
MDETTHDEDRTIDRRQIKDALYRWARGVDRKDWEMVRSVFHPDGYDDHGLFKGHREELIGWLQGRHQLVSQSMHFIGNILIDFAGPVTAVCETYVIGYQRYPDGDLKSRLAVLGAEVGAQPGEFDMTLLARYVDIFERRQGEWRILDRITTFEVLSADLVKAFPKIQPGWTPQRRDLEDALYVQRAKVGLPNPQPVAAG